MVAFMEISRQHNLPLSVNNSMDKTVTSNGMTPAERTALLPRLFPNIASLRPVNEFDTLFPSRDLPAGAMVNRVCPSPTGFMHIGGVYMALINWKLARQTNGLFYVRIEDTDQKREIPGAMRTIVDALSCYGLEPDEGVRNDESGQMSSFGSYGPYIQTSRKDIYHAFVADMFRRGLAYPCFLTPDDIEQIRQEQSASQEKMGVYGRWSIYREAAFSTISQELDKGTPFVIRFRSPGQSENTVSWDDRIRGTLTLPENVLDIPLLKSDGIPTYHFAHVIDDHFMRTTDVIRGDEWIASTPLHIQLFNALEWEHPRYAHIAPIQTLDGDSSDPERASRRKLSKRRDPEANVKFYDAEGYPSRAVNEYLMNLANSSFEDWRVQNPRTPFTEFELRIDQINNAGALLDIKKLRSISQEIISAMDEGTLYNSLMPWLKAHEPDLHAAMIQDEAYARAIVMIERNGEKPCKRWITWKDSPHQIAPFFEEFAPAIALEDFPANVPNSDRCSILTQFSSRWNSDMTSEGFLKLLAEISRDHGYAEKVKDFKKAPGQYRGHLGDVAMVLRVALFHSRQAPDLFEVAKVMGEERIKARCLNAIASLGE